MRPMTLRTLRSSHLSGLYRRLYSRGKPSNPSTAPKPTPPSEFTSTAANDVAQHAQKQQNRLDRLLKRTPRFLHRHVSALRSAPITHISAFLILHEITAVVPLFGFASAFHYYHWLPTYFSEGAIVVAGVEKFGNYFRRKGWISNEDEKEAERLAEKGEARTVERKKKFGFSNMAGKGEDSVRIVVEFATAYAIVKALLIPRLMLSVWATPWFARWTTVPVINKCKTLFRRGTVANKSVKP